MAMLQETQNVILYPEGKIFRVHWRAKRVVWGKYVYYRVGFTRIFNREVTS